MQKKALIKNNRLEMTLPDRFNDKEVLIDISYYKPSLKTIQQIRYYYGVCLKAIAEHCGYESWELGNLHYELKRKFLTNEINSKITGEVIEAVPSLSTLTKVKMIEFLDNVIRWASTDLGIIIPEPIKEYENSK